MKKFRKLLISLLASATVCVGMVGMASCSLLTPAGESSTPSSVPETPTTSSVQPQTPSTPAVTPPATSTPDSSSVSSNSSAVACSHVWETVEVGSVCEGKTIEKSCVYCEETKTESIVGVGHVWENDVCTVCEIEASKGLEIVNNELVGVGNCKDTKIYLPSTITKVADDALSGFAVIEYLEVIGNTEIGANAFSGCENLTKVVFGDAVTTIGTGAFSGCENLTTVVFGDSVATIGDNAFSLCENLKSVEFPASLQSVGEYAFSECETLQSAVFNVAEGSEGAEIGAYAFSECDDLATLTLYKNSWKWVGAYAFSKCYALTDLVIEEGVETIDEYAFSNARALQKLSLPSSLTEIGTGAFSGARELSEVAFARRDKAELTISEDVFKGSDNVEKVVVYDLLDWVYFSFANEYSNPLQGGNAILCDRAGELTNFVLGDMVDAVESIGDYTFYNYKKLQGVTIGEMVTSIGAKAFAGCTNLTSIVFNATNCDDLTMESLVFENAGVDGAGIALSVGVNVDKIPAYLFATEENEPNLTSVSFVECKVGETCENCHPIIEEDSEEEIVITPCTDNVCMEIGEYAFYNCLKLTSAVLGSEVTTLNDYAFANCRGLKRFECSEGTLIYGTNVLDSCRKIEQLKIPGDAVELMESKTYLKDLTIYSGVIEEEEFEGCTKLKNLVIGGKVTEIGVSAFASCSSLETLVFEDGEALTLGNKVFKGCSALESVSMGNSVTAIPEYAFSGCRALKTLVLGCNVEKVGVKAFHGMGSKVTITIPASVTEIATDIFWGTSTPRVIFEDCIGWTARNEDGEEVDFTSTRLADPDVAASYLRSEYNDYTWYKD